MDGVELGTDIITGQRVSIPADERSRGTYMLGKNGTGKSTLIEQMILQDIHADHGVGLFDPHGDITNRILAQIPERRKQDVVLLDVGDKDYPFGLNLFDVEHLGEGKDLIAEQVVQAFQKVWGEGSQAAWGARMENLLRNTAYTLVEYPENTVLEITKLLYEDQNEQTKKRVNPFRQRLVAGLSNWVVQEYWEYDYDRLTQNRREEVRDSTINKVRQFTTNTTIRHIVGQSRSTVNFRKIMDEQKILLVRLALGEIDEQPVSLLGSVMIGQIFAAATSRARDTVRPTFHLYADEYQNFATPAFGMIINQARKYGIAVVMAHQVRDDLPFDRRNAPLSVANLIIFGITGIDAATMKLEFKVDPMPGEPIKRIKTEPVYKEWSEEVWAPPGSPDKQVALQARLGRMRRRHDFVKRAAREGTNNRQKFYRYPGPMITSAMVEQIMQRSTESVPLNTYESDGGVFGSGFFERYHRQFTTLLPPDEDGYFRFPVSATCTSPWEDWMQNQIDKKTEVAIEARELLTAVTPLLLEWRRTQPTMRCKWGPINTTRDLLAIFTKAPASRWSEEEDIPEHIFQTLDQVATAYCARLSLTEALISEELDQCIGRKTVVRHKVYLDEEKPVEHFDGIRSVSVYEIIPGPLRPINDVREEIAEELVGMPRFRAKVRIGSAVENPPEPTIKLDKPEMVEISERVRDEYRQLMLSQGYIRPVADVIEEIDRRRRGEDGSASGLQKEPKPDAGGPGITEDLPKSPRKRGTVNPNSSG